MGKRYLAELIGNEFKQWGRKKVIITAPTGMGKTTFIVDVLLPYLSERKKKLLILCNRKLLREQYLHTIVRKYSSYVELSSSVKVMSYQELTADMNNAIGFKNPFLDYDTIVCDEVHYFYEDSDFNGRGTYLLFQYIIYMCMSKGMIFMSATTENVIPVIEQTIHNCYARLRKYQSSGRFYEEYGSLVIHKDYSVYADYSRFHCVCVPDEKTLCGIFSESDKKSIIFIDSKVKAQNLMENLIKINGVEKGMIAVLNSDNIDDNNNSELIRNLTISHRLIPKILITTSVLDNGVSIHDSDVENLAIITESKVSFLQMLGRVRSEKVEYCNLYYIYRKEDAFLQKRNRYKGECEYFEKLDKEDVDRNRYYYLGEIMADTEMAEFYKKALVLGRYAYHCFTPPRFIENIQYGEVGLYINEFARRKIGDMYIAEDCFYSLAVSDPLEVIYEQMSWIEKGPDELQVLESEYHKLQEKKFIDKLLEVHNFSQEDMQVFKRELVKKYRKEFFPDILAKNGVLSADKLQNICEKYGLQYRREVNSETRRNSYFINRCVTEDL